MISMEFELEGGSIEVTGDIEVTLPNYMMMLPKEELEEARRASQRDQMIIAVGRRPGTSDIVLFTADNRLLCLNAMNHNVPTGKVLPIDWGHGIAIDVEGSSRGYYEMTSDWVIENADPIDIALLT